MAGMLYQSPFIKERADYKVSECMVWDNAESDGYRYQPERGLSSDRSPLVVKPGVGQPKTYGFKVDNHPAGITQPTFDGSTSDALRGWPQSLRYSRNAPNVNSNQSKINSKENRGPDKLEDGKISSCDHNETLFCPHCPHCAKNYYETNGNTDKKQPDSYWNTKPRNHHSESVEDLAYAHKSANTPQFTFQEQGQEQRESRGYSRNFHQEHPASYQAYKGEYDEKYERDPKNDYDHHKYPSQIGYSDVSPRLLESKATQVDDFLYTDDRYHAEPYYDRPSYRYTDSDDYRRQHSRKMMDSYSKDNVTQREISKPINKKVKYDDYELADGQEEAKYGQRWYDDRTYRRDEDAELYNAYYDDVQRQARHDFKSKSDLNQKGRFSPEPKQTTQEKDNPLFAPTTYRSSFNTKPIPNHYATSQNRRTNAVNEYIVTGFRDEPEQINHLYNTLNAPKPMVGRSTYQTSFNKRK